MPFWPGSGVKLKSIAGKTKSMQFWPEKAG